MIADDTPDVATVRTRALSSSILIIGVLLLSQGRIEVGPAPAGSG